MACVVPPPGERDPSRIVAAIRQIIEGRGNNVGTIRLQAGKIATTSGLVGGIQYSPGVHPGIPLLGGTGSGAIATITVGGGGNVTAVSITNPGSGYTIGDTLTASAIPGTSGAISGLTRLSGGGGYTDGFYPGEPLTGGVGFGATADITVVGGIVTTAVLNNPGAGYNAGNLLTDSGGIGPGAGLTLQVTGVTGTGFSVNVATLTGGTTVVAAPNCSPSSEVFLSPRTAAAAAALPTTYILYTDIIKGQFTITHSSAGGDSTFGWLIRG